MEAAGAILAVFLAIYPAVGRTAFDAAIMEALELASGMREHVVLCLLPAFS